MHAGSKIKYNNTISFLYIYNGNIPPIILIMNLKLSIPSPGHVFPV